MPTALPIRSASGQRLSWPAAARLLILVGRLRLLDLQLHVVIWLGYGLADDRLLRLMRRWLACHDAISALLPGIPEPVHVAQVRAILGVEVTLKNGPSRTLRLR